MELASHPDHPGVVAALAGSAALEYLFPPFPGDTITLFGATLITAHGWNFTLVFLSVLAGSAVGSMIDYFFGHHLARIRGNPGDRAAKLDLIVERFRRYGPAYLAINRFLPGIRALFFVAAGMAGMRAWTVLFYSVLSAGLWNLAIIGLGSLLGMNWDALVEWVGYYTTVVWIALAALALGLILRHHWRKRTP